MKFLLILICAGGLLTCPAAAQSPVSLTVDTRSPGFAIPADFTGLSFETWAELPDHSGVSGWLFSATNTQFVTLFTNSGIRNLRLGGCTVEGLRLRASVPSRADIDNVFGFARAANIKVIYSLRLLNGDAGTAADTAQYIWTHYRRCLHSFAIGNEPDVKSYVYPPFGRGTDPAITNYSSYLARWRTFAAAVLKAAPGAKLVGPDAAGRTWATRFVRDEVDSGTVVLATQHEYVGGRPFVGGRRREMPAAVAIDNMLSQNWVTNRYPQFHQRTLAHVAEYGLSCRMTEANDYLRGVTNASNAFASALWALDYMHWWAAHGCAGVNFHNNQQHFWLKTDTIYLEKPGGSYAINPKAYAIRAFDLGSQGHVEPVAIRNAGGLNLTAYAVGNPTNLCVTIINKEHGPGARDAGLTITAEGFSFKSARVMFLTAPGHDAGATTGVTLGGAPITNNAPWRGSWTTMKPAGKREVKLIVPATSAAVVKLSAD